MANAISQWAEASWWGTFVRESSMGFALASVVLLFGIALLLSGIFFMSLRLLGLIMSDRPIPQVARSFRTWTTVGLVATLLSGPSMWAATATRYYDSPPFWTEMQLLAAAIVFHFTVFDPVSRREATPWALRALTAAVALVLWFGVGVAGRMIGFF